MPNRTTPEFWNHDVSLNRLTRDAELFFRKLDLLRDDSHRFPIIPSPQQPRNLWSALYYLREGVRLTDVARWLDEIQKAGAIAVRDSERGWYGEIAEHLRYQAEDFAKGVPRYGPRLEKPPEQHQLPLGPVSLLKPVPVTKPKSIPYDYDSGNGNDHDSARVLPMKAVPVESGNRALSSGEGNSRFARSPEVLMKSPLGRRLFTFLGMVQTAEECSRSGAEWERILVEEAEALEQLLDQAERMRAELPTGIAKAKFLTKRLSERRAA